MKYFIATTWKTHSGKTTFWERLSKQIKNTCLLDNDIITDFLRKTYPKLYQDDLDKSGKPTKDYKLKDQIIMALINASYKKNINTIYTASSATKQIRHQIKEQANNNNKKLILVYLNFPDNILLNRINNTERKKNNKDHIKKFTDLLINKQSLRYEIPTSDEADLFFEIKNEEDITTVEQKIIQLVNK